MIRVPGILGVSMVVAVLAAAGCGSEDSGQPGGGPSSSQPSSPTATIPSATPSKPHGTPSTDCPDTITAVRTAVEKATWGKGATRSPFEPVGVTICQYDAEADGQDYATVMTKRTGKQSQDLMALVNGAKVTPSEPRVCTKELGPTYVLRFVDNERGVLSYAVEAFGCRRTVATSFEGQGKPGDLAAPRVATPPLIKSLAQR